MIAIAILVQLISITSCVTMLNRIYFCTITAAALLISFVITWDDGSMKRANLKISSLAKSSFL
jgi:hypothetical protein